MKYFRKALEFPRKYSKFKVRIKTHVTQASIFENYSEHEFGTRLRALSNLLNGHKIDVSSEKHVLSFALFSSRRRRKYIGIKKGFWCNEADLEEA